jgi:stress response protein YsnF
MLVLVEEIRIHRRLTTETHEIPVMLRSEHAEVERDTGQGGRGEPHVTGRD